VWQPLNEQLEVFSVGPDGTVRGYWKEHNSQWRPSFNLTGPGFAPPGAAITAVFQPLNQQLEVFVVASDGAIKGIWKANNQAWAPPFNLTGPGFAPPGAPIAAVWQPLNEQLEVFVIGTDGAAKGVWKAHNAAWAPPFNLTGPGFAPAGAGIAAVFQPLNSQLEVFAVDDAGAVSGVWKDNNSAWHADFNVTGPGFAPPGAPVAAVWQPLNEHLEVFAVGTDGAMKGAWKAHNAAWAPPFNLTPPGFAPPGAGVAAVWQPLGQQLEVFAVDGNGAVSGVWKASDSPWRAPFDLTGPGVMPAGTSIAAVWQPLNEQLEVFAVQADGDVQGVWKEHNGAWKPTFTPIGPPPPAPTIAVDPMAGRCTQFYRGLKNGRYVPYRDDQLFADCNRIMGWDQYCASRDAFIVFTYATNGTVNGMSCQPYSRDLSPGEELELLVTGIAEGLADAFTAAAPFLTPVISGIACINGVLYSCAILALDVADLAGAGAPAGVARDALDMAKTLADCADGNIVACASAGQKGAHHAGLEIPAADAAQVAVFVEKCSQDDFAACARVGKAAAQSAGIPLTPGVNLLDAQECLNTANGEACLAIGKAASKLVDLIGSIAGGAENGQKCTAGDDKACMALGHAVAVLLR
jgi:hypothetical protein